MHQSVVELGTEICHDTAAARQQVVQLRRELAMVAERRRLTIASAGTHPFSHWRDQLITMDERYATIVKTCSRLRAPISSSGSTFTLAFPIGKLPFGR